MEILDIYKRATGEIQTFKKQNSFENINIPNFT